jgi:hypothetical protein
MSAAATARRAPSVASRKAKERFHEAQSACNVVAGVRKTGLVIDGGQMANYVTSGALRELHVDLVQLSKLDRNGSRCSSPPKGALKFLQLLAMLVSHFRPEGQKGGDPYAGAELRLADLRRMRICSPRQWGREGGTLAWLTFYKLVERIPTTVKPRPGFKNRAGRTVKAREGTPIYVAGEALLQLLAKQRHRAAMRLLRAARKLAKLRSQSSGVSPVGETSGPLRANRPADEKPSAPLVTDADLLFVQLQRVAPPWWSKESRKARRQKSVERKKRKEGGGRPAAAGDELERSQRSPAAAGEAIATSVPSAPAAPAPLPWQPPSAPAFATPAPLAELRAALAGVRLAVDGAPDVVVGPMPIGAPGSSQLLVDAQQKPAAIGDVLAAILGKGKP